MAPYLSHSLLPSAGPGFVISWARGRSRVGGTTSSRGRATLSVTRASHCSLAGSNRVRCHWTQTKRCGVPVVEATVRNAQTVTTSPPSRSGTCGAHGSKYICNRPSPSTRFSPLPSSNSTSSSSTSTLFSSNFLLTKSHQLEQASNTSFVETHSSIATMQSVMAGTLYNGAKAVAGALETNKKIADLKKDIHEPTPGQPMTNDHGVRQGNADIWLSASTPDRQGPQLLEDNWAREKVCQHVVQQETTRSDLYHRSTASTTSGFQNVSSTPVVPVPLVPSRCMRVPPT